MLSPDTVLQNRYRIVRQLGQGGMGTVYEAIDERLDTAVALKETKFTDERLRKQFEREARLLARLHHPALPRVTDHFTESDGQFLIMQFIPGEDLSDMLNKRGKPFPVNEVIVWADQLLDALDYLHAQEPPVIHRDIKPQNMKLTSRGQIILLDFGLAKGFAGQVSRITASGSIFGYTPNYAPLEQIQGTGTDPRSDLYALAATLYHLLTGVAPPDVLTRLTATSNSQTDPLRPAHELNSEVPTGVSNVLQKGLAIGSNQRFARASAMRKAFESVSQTTRDTESNRTTSSQQTILNLPSTQVVKEEVAPATRPDPSGHDSPSRLIDQSVLIARAPSIKSEPQPEVWRPQPTPAQPAPKQSSGASLWLLIVGGILAFVVLIYIVSQMVGAGSENRSESASYNLTNTTVTTNTYTSNMTMTPYSGNMSSSSNANSDTSSVSFYPYTGRLTSLAPKTVGSFTLDSTDTSPDEEFRKTLGASEMIDSLYVTSGGRSVHLGVANFSTSQKTGIAFSALKELFSQSGFRVVDQAVSGKVVMEGKASGKSGATRFIMWTKGTILFNIKNRDDGDTQSVSDFERGYPYSF